MANENNPYFTGQKKDCKLYNFVNNLIRLEKAYAYFKSGAFFTSTYDDFVNENNYSITFTYKEWKERGMASPYWIDAKGIYNQYDWSWKEKMYMLKDEMPKPTLIKKKTAKDYEAEIINKDYFAKSKQMYKNMLLCGVAVVPKKEIKDSPEFRCFLKNSEQVIKAYNELKKQINENAPQIEFIVDGEKYKASVSYLRKNTNEEFYTTKPTISITKNG